MSSSRRARCAAKWPRRGWTFGTEAGATSLDGGQHDPGPGAGSLADAVVVPGATLTETVRGLAEQPGTSELLAAETERTPSGRLTTPEEVARLIVFLGSAANGNVNGAVIHTAGGR